MPLNAGAGGVGGRDFLFLRLSIYMSVKSGSEYIS